MDVEDGDEVDRGPAGSVGEGSASQPIALDDDDNDDDGDDDGGDGADDDDGGHGDFDDGDGFDDVDAPGASGGAGGAGRRRLDGAGNAGTNEEASPDAESPVSKS